VKNSHQLPDPDTDAYVDLLDRVTDTVLEVATPYISNARQAEAFALDALQSLETHLAAELRYVATGRGDGCNGTRAMELRRARRTARWTSGQVLC